MQKNKIYDYENVENYNKFFTSLYKKKEAIDFLLEKIKENDINELKEMIQPTDRILNIKDIKDTQDCIEKIAKMKEIKDNNNIFLYIKSMNQTTISQFENFSKIYLSIIELDRDYKNSKYEEENSKEVDDSKQTEQSGNLYKQVNNIIKFEAIFIIHQDYEEFKYLKEKGNSYEELTMQQLIELKNRIHIKDDKKKDDEKEKEKSKSEGETLDIKKEESPKDIYDEIIKKKRKEMIFFKETITNLEIILDYMKDLRNKGSSLPIIITIKIKGQNIEYFLGEQLNNFESIRKFLSNAKDKYITQLNLKYREDVNLRILYGQQFRSLMKHLSSGINIDSFLRYILNYTDNDQTIKEGYRTEVRTVKDYIKYYEEYNEDSLRNISSYITTVFTYNDLNPEKHYDNMKIIPVNKYKGIYSYECENNTMEKCIINLFIDIIYGLPIAQNVLITNEETSSEEMQAFFHRAILCNYNTLFVVEINDSFSIHQQSIMNNYVNNLLSYKNNDHNEKTKQNIDKKK